MLDALPAVLDEIISPSVFVCIAIGTVVGLVASSMPGVAGSLAVIVLLPFTTQLSLFQSLGMLLGAYKAINFGGVIPAVGLGIPGSPEAAAATPDLYAMTKEGKPRRAIGLALQAGTIGDLVSNLLTMIALPLLATLALALGSRELLAVAVLALFILPTAVSGGGLKSGIAIVIGLVLSLVGPDPISGFPRLTFGVEALRGGIDVIPMVVGLLAMSVVTIQAAELGRVRRNRAPHRFVASSTADDTVSWRHLSGSKPELALGSFLGSLLGSVPGPGATMAAYSAYGISSRFRKNRGTYGTGSPSAIVAAESANNATIGPALVPLLAFGIPGSALTAVIAGAFLLQGVTPGPATFQNSPEIALAFLGLLWLATLINYPLGRIFIQAYKVVPSIRPRVLVPVVGMLLVVATYTSRNDLHDVYIMITLGLFGYLLSLAKIPTAPVVVAFLIGPILETELRRALTAGGSWSYLLSSNVAIGLYVLAVVLLVVMVRGAVRQGRGRQRTPEPATRHGDEP